MKTTASLRHNLGGVSLGLFHSLFWDYVGVGPRLKTTRNRKYQQWKSMLLTGSTSTPTSLQKLARIQNVTEDNIFVNVWELIITNFKIFRYLLWVYWNSSYSSNSLNRLVRWLVIKGTYTSVVTQAQNGQKKVWAPKNDPKLGNGIFFWVVPMGKL